MLSSLRVYAKSWVSKGMMVSLAAAFALWGINDIFRGGGIDNTVATVGKQAITAVDYDRELRAEIRNLSQRQHTDVTLEQVRTSGLAQQWLERMIEGAALDNEAADLRLIVSTTRVANDIRSMQQFQAKGGTFSRALFDQVMQQNNYNEATFEERIRLDTLREQMLSSTIDAFAVPTGLARIVFDYINQSRNVEYIVLTPDMAGNAPAPSEADLEAYHKANAANFSTPEYRELEYVEIGPEMATEKIQVSDADLRKEYEAHEDNYVKPEQRTIEQINFPSEQAANDAQQRLLTGTDFAALAHSIGLKDDELNLGTFARSGLSPKLADAAFAVSEGGVTPAIHGPFGWVILRVTKVIPGLNRTFDELKDTLRQAIVKARAVEQTIEAANAFEDARAGGMSLVDAAKKVGAESVHIPAVDNKGLAPDGTKVNLPVAPTFLQQAFAAEAGEEGDLFQTDDQHSYAIKVIGIRPPAVKPLAQVREQVVKEWTEEQHAKQLLERTKALSEQAQKEHSLASVEKALGRPALTGNSLKRDTPNDVFSLPVLARLFGVPPGDVIAGPLGKGQGFVIARVLNVKAPDPNTNPGEFQNDANAITQQMVGDLAQSFAASARATQGVTYNQKAFDRIFAGSVNDE